MKKISTKNQHLLAREPDAPALCRPFFLMMKLDPMKALDPTANPNPIKLSVCMTRPAPIQTIANPLIFAPIIIYD